METKEVLVLVILYLSCLYLWTLPIQKNRMPFAEPDGINFFGLADWMAQNDQPIWILPHHYLWRYGNTHVNPTKPEIIWYPPPYHTNLALMQIIGGDRILPIYIFLAITNSLVILTIYFLLRKLFGFWSAILASLMLIFSLRDYMTHLWGQWPTILSFSFIPLILYCYYRYTSSYLDGKEKKIYAYILPFIMVSQFLIHPVGTFNAVLFLIVFSILLVIKYQKFPFSLKTIIIVSLAFLFLAFVLDPVHFTDFVTKSGASDKALDFNNLLHFSKFFESGYPLFWFEFNRTIGPWWVIPFLLVGIGFLLFRRKQQDLLLLSWLLGLYIFLQFLMYHNIGRYVRNIIEIAHIFYPLIAIGIVYLFSFFRIPYKKYAKLGLILIFAILIINSNGKAAYETLRGAYGGPLQRINRHQYEAAEWMNKNLELEDDIFDVFTWLIVRDLNNIIWIQTIAQRHIRGVKLPWQNTTLEGKDEFQHDANYVLVDYSKLVIANAMAEINKMQEWEKTFLQNETLVYDKNNIRIYGLSDSWYLDRERDNFLNMYGEDTRTFKGTKVFKQKWAN